MGCEVQIHKKVDKRGMWSYHSVDGWYLSTSPEHYRVHNCYAKTTQAERLTDTTQFKHNNKPYPTISSHDKIMHALANGKTALKGMMNDNPTQQMEELQTIVTNAHAYLNQRKETNSHQVPRVESRQVPRVDTNEPNQTPPRPSDNHTPNRMSDPPTARRRRCRNSLLNLTAKINLPAATPAMSTRSKVRVANEHQRQVQPWENQTGQCRRH